MKTYRNLYPQIATFSNLLLAFGKARIGKRGKAGVAAFWLLPNVGAAAHRGRGTARLRQQAKGKKNYDEP